MCTLPPKIDRNSQLCYTFKLSEKSLATSANSGRKFKEEVTPMETKPLTPPEVIVMTDGQIDKATDIFRSQLRKHRGELPSDPVQLALGQPELGTELLAVFRKRVEAVSNMIVRHVRVDRGRKPQQVLDATGRVQHTDKSVVATMPRGEGDEVDVCFFKVGRYISDADLEKEYELRGLKPDPYAQAQVNGDDPAFADEYPNGTHWKGDKGRWCFATFGRSLGERFVDVNRDGGWGAYWWFGGVRK